MLWCLAALQLFLAPALQLPSGDYWEEWSPYGECSRSCGSGVTMRTRRCVTQRTDGGNNCVGPDMSYRSCNIQDCPGGSRDFREHQCSQFDGADFQGKRYNWLPYYGADNPCELNCIPRGENFFYRHKTAVVDGTPCHPGRKEVCVDGVCKAPPVPILPAENSIQCRLTIYGCCFDRMSAAAGPDGEGCPGPPDNVPRTTCSLPMAAGSCSGWTGRYFYDVTTTKCSHFWYGGCHGNNNNFLTRGDCQSRCPGAQTSQTSHTYQHSQPSSQLIQPSQPIQPGTGRDMSRVFTVQRGSSGGSTGGRQGTSVTGHAHRARVHVRPRHPYAVQQTHPAASLTQPGGVKIDQSDPSRVEALVGQTVVLPCRVSPAPSSTIIVEWRKDGVPLTTFRHHLQPNGSLLVGPLTKADSGWLLCVATRDRERDHRYIYLSVSEDPRGSQVVQDTAGSLPQDGADRTEETGVILQSVPQRQPSPRFSIDRSGSSSVEGKAGQTVRLACKIIPTSALSSVSIQWTRGGQTFNSLRHAQQADGTLVIGQLTSDDSDVYTCIGSTHSQLEQRQLTLKVQGELRITMVPNNVRVSQGSTAQLPCVVSGDNVNVGWSRNGVPVRPDSGRVQISSDGSLILNNVQPADEGSYTCNAYTGTYSVSATAEVRINKASQQGLDVGIGVPAECVDQPELANCELIVYARLCTSQYYSSFCCASCARHAHGQDRYGQIG